ncbi:DNA-3-methyladenine glycosylase I [Peteryoungia algae]|uniref:DNA-3-methyladenine glycosylase I n=1 Tax=Peteryoungia algae TaxID=2919917 RepID=A0ABT0CWL0_9HYPH|nr:DNA-3-methyladenine glycosylase I [Rhizobium sp. SSM4.3]MCJ8237549.1 DNA-3-methyladenine glycosylase I [Rhizobium sp. SSM4.3]
MIAEGLIREDDGLDRCFWYGGLEDYRRYHDEEWGKPVTDDVRLFEKICLEGFQSGLSWLTILRKRENFRAAFAGFDFHAVARFGDDDIARCLADAGIIRHRGKIVSTINNARRAIDLQAEFGSLFRYFWSYEPDASERPKRMDYATLKANPTSPTSIRLSKDLKKRGWTFVGPTTVYAFMQAMGLVNDHIEGCCCRDRNEELRAQLVRP